MATPHNEAKKGDIAKTVLMPGDPLRAKFIAEKYFQNPVRFNGVRNMNGYTGTYGGKEISVMGSGMGCPSIGIYSYELYSFYDVENIIRIGSIGGYADCVNLRDIIIAMTASTNSAYVQQYGVRGTFAPGADFTLLEKAVEAARKNGARFHVGSILSSDTFYDADHENAAKWKAVGILGVEMETAALYANAAVLGKKALSICTVSDTIFKNEALNSAERQTSFTEMMEIALETAVSVS